jgi:hypothetical protein
VEVKESWPGFGILQVLGSSWFNKLVLDSAPPADSAAGDGDGDMQQTTGNWQLTTHNTRHITPAMRKFYIFISN